MDARDLANWLAEAPPDMVVRLVVDWIDKAVRLGLEAEVEPPNDSRCCPTARSAIRWRWTGTEFEPA